jgi:hypothetical protein
MIKFRDTWLDPRYLLRRLSSDKTDEIGVPFSKAIASCRGTLRANCIGTALYIIGELGEDKYITPYSGVKELYLKNLEPIQTPSEYCLIVWACTDCIEHMGVVTGINPILVTNREHADGEFIVNQGFEKANKPYHPDFRRHRGLEIPSINYYLPRSPEFLSFKNKIKS